MREINEIVIHSAHTPEGVYYDIDDIRKWHVFENGWADVGYHYVILLDGTIQLGRDISKAGAHVSGHNKNSIGICYIGGMDKDTRTNEQKRSIVMLLKLIKSIHKDAIICGHRDFPGVTKLCPNFNAIEEYSGI